VQSVVKIIFVFLRVLVPLWQKIEIPIHQIMKLTAIISKGKNGFLIGRIKEIPEVFTQGKTIEETKGNIIDALELYLEDMREEYKSGSL